MKTAVSVLQEMMVKQGQVPEYEYIAQAGPQHQATFEYRCIAYGVSVTAIARSKKEAKQEAARLMLLELDERGYQIPPPFCKGGAPVHPLAGAVSGAGAGCGAGETPAPVGPLSARSYVALLNELCEEYCLPAVEYELTADTGPPHARHFTVCARMSMYERRATSTTKKFARQLAAEQLYTYLKENLIRVIKDFKEEAALARAHEKAMERYEETRDETARRPNLGQRIADYDKGLVTNLDEEKRLAALEAIAGLGEEETLNRVTAVLGLTVEWRHLPLDGGGVMPVVTLTPTSPEVVMMGEDKADATRSVLRYLRRALSRPATQL